MSWSQVSRAATIFLLASGVALGVIYLHHSWPFDPVRAVYERY